jgi:hypothetical protein
VFFGRRGLNAGQSPISPFRKSSGFPRLAGSCINQGPLLFDYRENEVFIFKCRTSTTLSGSDNHFGRSLSRCDVAYFK